MKKRCLLICYTNLASDPRVVKHYEALKDKYEIITAGTTLLEEDLQFVQIAEFNFWDNFNKVMVSHPILGKILYPLLKIINFFKFKLFNRFYFLRYWNIKRVLDFLKLRKLNNIDLIIANDINTLPLAVSLAKTNTKVVYDAHEYHAEEYGERRFWVIYNKPLVQYLYRKYIQRVDLCITVGENIAKRYESDFQKPFAVIYNTPPYSDIALSTVNPERISLVYSGMFGPNRNIDQVIELMDYLPSHYELNLVITNIEDRLKKMINTSKSKNKIRLHKSVPLKDVAKFLSQFDIGVHLMAAVNFNNDNALPNKYFQYIQARIVTAFGPLSEINLFSKKHHTGIISEDFTGKQMADAILKLSVEDINRIKNKNHENARLFCEENELTKLKSIYNQVMS